MRKLVLFFSVSIVVLLSCKNHSTMQNDTIMKEINQQENLLATLQKNNLKDFIWFNEPDEYSINKNSISITAGGKTDYFNDPSSNTRNANAPFLYKEISGDFVATALLKPDFNVIRYYTFLLKKGALKI